MDVSAATTVGPPEGVNFAKQSKARTPGRLDLGDLSTGEIFTRQAGVLVKRDLCACVFLPRQSLIVRSAI